jgi:FkbM family methyltransferase
MKNLRHELETIAAIRDSRIEYLKTSRLPLVLWGAAECARNVKSMLDRHDIAIDFVVVDDSFYRLGQFFFNIPISRWEDVRKKQKVDMVIAFVPGKEKVAEMQELPEVGYCLTFGEMSLPFEFDPDFVAQNYTVLETLFHRLSDELSRQVLLAFLKAKNLHSAEELMQWNIANETQYFPNFLSWTNSDVFVDCGAFDGDTIAQFCEQVQGRYKKIYAFECDPHNAERLRGNVAAMRKNAKQGGGDIILIEKGVFSSPGHLSFRAEASGSSCIDNLGEVNIEVDSIDNVAQGEKVSFIKMDIEGAELEALKGARETIRHHKPKLAICVYHKQEDLITIPQYILSLREDYRLYLRHYGDTCAETVLYAV